MENTLPYNTGSLKRKVNGWTNYETWAANLWLDNDVKQYELMTAQAQKMLRHNEGDKEQAAYGFAEWLQTEIEDKAPSYLNGVYQDLLNGALSAINYREIAFNWIEGIEYTDQEKSPEPLPEEPRPTKKKPIPSDGLLAEPQTKKLAASKHMETATPEILEIIGKSAIDEAGLTLPGEQLDRETYEAVNNFLKLAGAKWHKGKKRHLFVNDVARAKITELLETGKLLNEKKHFQAFYTPAEVVNELVHMAGLAEGMDCLEPSAGEGAIALAAQEKMVKLHCYEINPDAARILEGHGFKPAVEDFLLAEPAMLVDRVLMNPPFTNDQDIKHVLHAYCFLKPGGKLYAIMSPGFTFGGNKARTSFRDFVAEHGRIIKELPEGTFSESGTEVRTIIVELVKPAEEKRIEEPDLFSFPAA